MREGGGVLQLDKYCNICSSFTQGTSQSCLKHSQVDNDLEVTWIESELILHNLKVGCPNFGHLRGSAIYHTSVLK